MNRFVLDKKILGTEKNFIIDNGFYSWSTSLPRDTWHMSGECKNNSTARCLDTLLRLVNVNLPTIPKKYLESFVGLIPPGSTVQWQLAVPQNVFKEYFKNLVDVTKQHFSSLPFDYFEMTWPSGSRVLNSLRPAKINIQRWSYLSEVSGSSPAVESFRPNKTGYAAVPEYDRFGTRTGRLTVKSGANIHVLKRENRNLIMSSFDDGKIVSLDFRALEARVILAEAGKSSDAEDLYGYIANNVCGGADRNTVKTAVISELYGASKGSLSQRLQMNSEEVNRFVQNIRSYFGTPLLRERLKLQLEKNGKIYNRFGRPLFIDTKASNLLVNTYAQSTGADVSLLGFDAILQKIGSDGIRPLFVLHDAIILDVRGDRISDVQSVLSVPIPSYDMEFPLKFELV